jgi:hypothetical protein
VKWWTEVTHFLHVARLYRKALRLRNARQFERARETVFECAALSAEPYFFSHALSSFLPPLLAELSDKVGRWDGDAELMRKAVTASSAIPLQQAKPSVIAQAAWMKRRLAWLESLEAPRGDGPVLH